MEELRDSLIEKIDDIVSDLYQEQNGSPNTQLQIEATVLGQDRSRKRKADSRKFVLGTFDIGNWKSPAQTPVTPRIEGSSQRIDGLQVLQQGINPSENDSRRPPSSDGCDDTRNESPSRRKTVGGLRIGSSGLTPPRTPSPPGTRQLGTDQRSFPKRRRLEEGPAKLRPSTVDKLIEGIWEQIHKPNVLVIPEDISKTFQRPETFNSGDFADVSRRCRVLTGVSRTTRSIEVMMQAHWVDCYYARIEVRHLILQGTVGPLISLYYTDIR